MARPDAYATHEVADAYFADDPDAVDWLGDSVTNAVKTALLLKASDVIDRQLLKGRKVDILQPRAFPRFLEFSYLQSLTIPQAVVYATCEEANEMLKQLGTPRLNLQRQHVASVGFDGSNETFSKGAGRGVLSVAAREILRYYLLGAV